MRRIRSQDQSSTVAGQERKPRLERSFIQGLEARQLLSAASLAAEIVVSPNLAIEQPSATYVASGGYSPAQIREAYGFNSVSFGSGASSVAGLGQGQTIAIVDAYNDPNITRDLGVFDSTYGLANPPSFKVVNQSGGSQLPASNAGWAGEISLDVEWAHAIAPDANILLVEAGSASLGNLLAGVNYARNAAGVSVVSMSWGSSEFAGETAYDSDFTTPAGHQGVTFVAASGDSGSADGPEWPAVSPDVVSVGGTSLTLQNSGGSYGSESAWADSTGGISQLEPEPSYQDGVPSAYTSLVTSSRRGGHSITSDRSAPDVAYDADPNTGFAVYDTVPYEGYSGWEEIGGTSAGAPQWSALVAVADQGRALEGLGSLNGASQTLPDLYGIYANPGTAGYSTYGSIFNDVTAGGAVAGYDGLTGLGSPRAARVIATLTATSSSGPAATAATATVSSSAHSRANAGRKDATPAALPAVTLDAATDFSSSGSPLQTWTQLDEHFALADAAPTVLQHVGDLASPWTSSSFATALSAAAPAANSAGRLSGLSVTAAGGVQDVVSPGSLPGSVQTPPGASAAGALAHGSLLEKLGSLFSAAPIGGLGLLEPGLQPATVLGLSPTAALQQLQGRGWEMTAVGCLGATIAGCWYLHASRKDDDAVTKAQFARLRQAGPGWELTPVEER